MSELRVGENRASESRVSERRSARKPHGLLYYIGVGLSAGLLAFVVLVGVLVIVVPAAAGATPMTILTQSMIPTYPPGTLVIVKPIQPAEISIGDAITYQIESGRPDVVTHRVTSIIASSTGTKTFITKGDNNAFADEKPVLPGQIKGRVWYSVPWIGYVNNLVNGDNRGWIIPVLAIGLFLYAGYLFASGIASSARKKRRKRMRERAATSENSTT
jgi:signal peptidase I